MSIKNNTTILQEVLETINNLPEASSGVELPELTNEGTASDLLSGKQLIGQEGNIVTGSIPTKTSSDLTASGATVIVPSGYYASQATKSVATATQATPSVSIDVNGLITATATQTAGYVAAGTKSATKQLAFQAAKTITPSTTSQIAVSSGYYTGGNITVAAIPSQYVIPSGTLTISANGTHNVKNYASAIVNIESGSSGGGQAEWSANEDAIIARNISTYFNDRATTIGTSAFTGCYSLTTVSFPACTTIGTNAFANCNLTTVSFPACTSINLNAFISCRSLTTVSFPVCTSIGISAFFACYNLTTVNFPACITIGTSAFNGCYSLTTINFPVCTSIGYNAFISCYSLTTVSFPACTSIGNYAFASCRSLTTASFPVCTSIGISAFYNCSRLSSLTLAGSSICNLKNSNAFTSTPYAGYSTYFSGTPYIYVPSSLVTSYKTATNWTYFSSYFSAIEDMT